MRKRRWTCNLGRSPPRRRRPDRAHKGGFYCPKCMSARDHDPRLVQRAEHRSGGLVLGPPQLQDELLTQ